MKKIIFCAIALLMALPACTPEEKKEEAYNRELYYNYTKELDGVEMEVFLPTEEKNIGVAVIGCPGGSYSSHAAHEGAVWAPYFNDLGIAYVVLKYTLPNGDPSKPIDDMERALTILNDMSSKWLINRNKIGVMGFSAGGHLACYAATASEYPANIVPDFQILVYPVVTMRTGTHSGSRTNFLGSHPSDEDIMRYSSELFVSSQTPKAFITYAKSETVVPPASNGKAFYNAMINEGADAKLLELEGTKHGWHHGNADHERLYLQPMKEQLTPWLQNL